MDENTAKKLVQRVIDRMVEADGGLWRLESHISQNEYLALCDLVHASDAGVLPNQYDSDERQVETHPIIRSFDTVLPATQSTFLPKHENCSSQCAVDIPLPEGDELHCRAEEKYDYINCRLCEFIIPDEYRAIVELLLREVGDEATVGSIAEISDNEYLKRPGVGVTKLNAIRKLQQEILCGKYKVDVEASDNRGSSSDGKGDSESSDDIVIDDLEAVLLSGVDRYVASLNEKMRHVFVNRHGWKTPKLSLEETSRELPGGAVTRERVRQLQKKVDHNLLAKMPVSPKLLWLSIKSNLSLLGRPIYPKLRACFDLDADFYQFLELCCNADHGKITSVTQPQVKNNILDEFWVTNTSPADIHDVSEYLRSEHGLEHAVADNSLIMLMERGVVELTADKIRPRRLPKSVACAHALLFYPDGEDWKNIQSKVNELGVSRSEVTTKRLDGGVTESVNSGWVYQCGRGLYRSLIYLVLSENEIEKTLIDLRYKLEEAKLDARNAINLSVDFYDSTSRELEYYVVRHIARTYGEREKIFFNGKSGADTVSLDQEFTLESGKKAILDMFIKSDEPLSKQIIAGAIRSKSVGHATFYLDLLIKEGSVVRIENNTYALSENIFASANIPLIVECAARLVEFQNSAVEANKLQHYINRECDLDYNKYFYLSLLKMHASDFGYSWVYSRDTVSHPRVAATSPPD